MPKNLSFTLYYDKSSKLYSNEIEEIVKKLGQLSFRFKANFRILEKEQINDETRQRIAEKIRSIIPQRRGGIVSSRNMILPLSGSKKLNLGNTPILVIEEGGKPVFVFPCRVEETPYSLNNGIDHLRANLPVLAPLVGKSEGAITSFLLKHPEMIEKGLHEPEKEVDTSSGLADIVFRDSENKYLLIEVEREASDESLGQILRLCAAYEKKLGIGREFVRGMIVCLRTGNILAAASRAGIGIKEVKLKELANNPDSNTSKKISTK